MTSLQNRADILQDRFARKTTAYLSAAATHLPYEVSERLRAARTQAVSARKIAPLAARQVHAQGTSATLTWGGDAQEGMSWWTRLGTALPVLVLMIGLLVINTVQNDNRAEELAEIDTALLTDELPPAAFTDPGFLQFLKTPPQASVNATL